MFLYISVAFNLDCICSYLIFCIEFEDKNTFWMLGIITYYVVHPVNLLYVKIKRQTQSDLLSVWNLFASNVESY